MERSIIKQFQCLRVLAPFDFKSMDELVQDLTNALEESSRCNVSKKYRKRRGLKRRSKQNNVPIHELCNVGEDSESSLDEAFNSKEPFDSMQQTDSDDVSPASCLSALNYIKMRPYCIAGSFAESDSVNENFSPVRPHRRKRKFKRMAVDPSPCSSVQADLISPMFIDKRNKALKVLKHHGEIDNLYPNNKLDPYSIAVCGKRKRSMRERSVELLEGEVSMLDTNHCHSPPRTSNSPCREHHGCCYLVEKGNSEDAEHHMDCCDGTCNRHRESSSSGLSSSESDAGVYTNDEGREGDDEQSDFYHEAGPACGIPGILPWWESEPLGEPMSDELDPKLNAILRGSFQHLSLQSSQPFRPHVSRLGELNPGREIRAGRRRLRDRRPGFSIIASFNEKISKFLQDPDQNELWLHPIKKRERDQLSHLANLYCLNMRSEGSSRAKCPVLTKTRYTTQAISIEQNNYQGVQNRPAVNDIKRRRKTPPPSPSTKCWEVNRNSAGEGCSSTAMRPPAQLKYPHIGFMHTDDNKS